MYYLYFKIFVTNNDIKISSNGNRESIDKWKGSDITYVLSSHKRVESRVG